MTSAATGAQFIAIPHNSNMSNGLMFDKVDSDGRPQTAAYARERVYWERVMEITQSKGTSETDPSLSPNDEFAGFEVRNKLLTGPPAKATIAFARTALMDGLAREQSVGVNPYKFGLIGSTDSHNSLVTVEESNYFANSPTRWPLSSARWTRATSPSGNCRPRALPVSGQPRTHGRGF
jgi:hypothetical protein